MKIIPVILAGGQGTRLWPLSRSSHPKQFMQFPSKETTLFQDTLQRINNDLYSTPVIVTHEDYRFLAASQLLELGITEYDLLLEPEAKNTSIAVAVATMFVEGKYGSNILHILPSDHLIDTTNDYYKAIKLASSENDNLVTFGINPTTPETGYGYLEVSNKKLYKLSTITKFVEKPDLATAKTMLDSNKFLWNSGMFMFHSKVFLDELKQIDNNLYVQTQQIINNKTIDLDFIRLNGYEPVESKPIDKTVFEKSKKIKTIPVDFSWNDLGSWNSLWHTLEKDTNNNHFSGNVIGFNVGKCLVISKTENPIVVNGLTNLTIIQSEDALYVGNSNSQNINDIVKYLNTTSNKNITKESKTTYRPWGGYTSLIISDRFQVKKIFVEPGKRLSLQKHYHRSEHWVVVKGTAEVTVDNDITLLSENESVYIRAGDIHRLSNPGKITLELIEIQTGSYLGEDDIIRLEDDYQR